MWTSQPGVSSVSAKLTGARLEARYDVRPIFPEASLGDLAPSYSSPELAWRSMRFCERARVLRNPVPCEAENPECLTPMSKLVRLPVVLTLVSTVETLVLALP